MKPTKTDRVRARNERVYDRLNCYLPRGRKAQLQAVLQAQGQTVNGWVNQMARLLLCVDVDDWRAPAGQPDEAEDAQ